MQNTDLIAAGYPGLGHWEGQGCSAGQGYWEEWKPCLENKIMLGEYSDSELDVLGTIVSDPFMLINVVHNLFMLKTLCSGLRRAVAGILVPSVLVPSVLVVSLINMRPGITQGST